ncbi:DUF222 domain-containing protein [Ilumatobacter sp.]
MTPAAILEQATIIVGVRSNAASCRTEVSRALVSVRQMRAWIDAQEARLITRLSAFDSFPEATIAEASRSNLGHAAKATERAATLGATPSLSQALEAGAITAGHVDAVTRARRQLDGPQRQRLLDVADGLTGVAFAATVEQFASRIRLEARRLQTDDGEDRLVRQKRSTRVSTWTGDDGMWNLRGVFDPETGVRLFSAIDSMVATTFAEAIPEHCPTDPIEKQKFLAAHAVVRLLTSPSSGGTSSTGSVRPQMVVAIDADAPEQPGPVAQWAIPVELPARVVAELAGSSDVTAVVVRNGVVLHAPGNLDLGRSTRLANRPQRRALRALYRTCAVPGCSTGFDRCRIHHVVWWRHGGLTNLDNLLPVCAAHHSRIHDDGWAVELGPNRRLTLRLPDGTVRSTGPPSIRAA